MNHDETRVSVADMLADGRISQTDFFRHHATMAASGTGWPMVWEDAPMPAPGETAPWSALHTLTFSDDPAGPDVLTIIPATSWGDYSGGMAERANMEYLKRHHADEVIVIYGAYGSEAAALPVTGTVSDTLADIIAGLADYPVIDDGLMSEMETDTAEESWESYGVSDMRRELARAGMSDDTLDAIDDAAIRDAWRYACDTSGFYPYAESAVDVVLWDAAIVGAIVDTLTV